MPFFPAEKSTRSRNGTKKMNRIGDDPRDRRIVLPTDDMVEFDRKVKKCKGSEYCNARPFFSFFWAGKKEV